MPFTAAEISAAGKVGLDHYVKNNPIDQVSRERPLLKFLMENSKEFPGAKQYITEQLRDSYDSNFQWYYGSQAVTYNSRKTIEQSNFSWRGWHDGFFLDEDRLMQNGITMTDDNKGGRATRDEVLQLTNLLEEQYVSLREGCEEQFDLQLHQDGTQDVEALEGLDHLIQTTPTAAGVVGGIDQVANAWWQNNAITGIVQANLLDDIEVLWRNCTRYGGMPNFILAGETFIDTYRKAIRAAGQYEFNPVTAQNFDATINSNGTDSGLRIKGVPVIWDPTFAELGGTWAKRAYFLNKKHIKLRPAKGHNMVSRKPPREYNRYVHYWALTWKGALCTNKRRSMGVMEVA